MVSLCSKRVQFSCPPDIAHGAHNFRTETLLGRRVGRWVSWYIIILFLSYKALPLPRHGGGVMMKAGATHEPSGARASMLTSAVLLIRAAIHSSVRRARRNPFTRRLTARLRRAVCYRWRRRAGDNRQRTLQKTPCFPLNFSDVNVCPEPVLVN